MKGQGKPFSLPDHLQGLVNLGERELLELDTTLTNMVLEESLQQDLEEKQHIENEEIARILEKTRREDEEEMLRIRMNYEESLRRSTENPRVIYELNVYEDSSDYEDWDDSSDLDE